MPLAVLLVGFVPACVALVSACSSSSGSGQGAGSDSGMPESGSGSGGGSSSGSGSGSGGGSGGGSGSGSGGTVSGWGCAASTSVCLCYDVPVTGYTLPTCPGWTCCWSATYPGLEGGMVGECECVDASPCNAATVMPSTGAVQVSTCPP
jgi:hypothetical protein